MRHLLVRSLAVLAVIAVTEPMAHAATGRTPGTFTVAKTTGAATYSIPIWAPPGPQGLQPHIALTYNSQSGNGVAGVGWSISGLSSIYRCNATYAQDAAPGAVTLAYTDRFCLDGNRLRLTSSETLSTYGQVNTTYQTELANFSNVTASATNTGNGPAYFTVQGKDGLTYEYGNGANSQVVFNGTAVGWFLDKITDRSGNTMTVAYEPQSATLKGTTVPMAISWTPTAHGSTSYSYTMQFTYGINVAPSSDYQYEAGYPIVNTDLLNAITISYAGAVVKKYVLSYQSGPTTGREQLISVKECADSGATNCLTPSSFSYQNGSPGVGTTLTTQTLTAVPLVSYPLDVNGDGIPDLLFAVAISGSTTTEHWYVTLGTLAGFNGSTIDTTVVTNRSDAVLPADMTGTGHAGFIYPTGGGSSVWNWAHLPSGGSAFSLTSTGLSSGVSSDAIVADINGDGLPDLIYQSTDGTHLYYYLNATVAGGNLAFSSASATLWTAPAGDTVVIDDVSRSPLGHVAQVDVNGDGRTDLIISVYLPPVSGKTNVWYYALVSNGGSATAPAVSAVKLNYEGYVISPSNYVLAPLPETVDWNDDGCTDFVIPVTVGSTTYSGVALSPCSAAVSDIASWPVIVTDIGTSATAIIPIDWNGDGRTDLLWLDTTGGAHLAQSTGDGVLASVAVSLPFTSSYAYGATAIDIDGDGLADLLSISQTVAQIELVLHKSSGTQPDLVSNITDGFGNSVSPTYISLVRGNYTQNSDATYPEQNYIGPRYVASQAVLSDPSSATGGTYTKSFWYYGAWINLQGRGFDSFNAISELDSRLGLYNYYYFDRAWPIRGMLNETNAVQSDNATQMADAFSTNTYLTLDATVDNQRYFPYVSTSTLKSYEVGGTENADLISTAVTDYTYDNYGNATVIASKVTDNDPGSPYVGDMWARTTVNTPDVDTTHWCLGLFTETVTGYADNISSNDGVTRTKSFIPDTTDCRYTQVVTEPSSSSYKVTEAFGFDAFGNINSDTVTGVGMTARATSVNWGTTGQFPATVTDPSSAQMQFGYNFSFGTINSVTDPNGQVTSYAFGDGFGRRTQETRPDGTYTQYVYDDCTSQWGCVFGSHTLAIGHYYYNSDGSIQTEGANFYDAVERPLMSFNLMVGGQFNRNEVRYDNLGRAAQTAAPCLYTNSSTACTYWTTYNYDALNRVTQAQRPISSSNSSLETTVYSYAGRTSTVTDPNSIVSKTVSDVNGWLRQTKDALGYTVTLAYDAAGSKTGVTDSESHTLWTGSYAYGIAPFNVSATDADLGAWTYTYDALGEMTAWKDAKLQAFAETYDALSRPLTRKEPDLFTQWTWGSTASSHNVGKLTAACTGNGTNPTLCNSSGISEADTYDGVARLYQRTFTITGDSPLTYTYQYGVSGMVSNLTYPTTTSAYALQVKYGYSAGTLQSITDVSDTPNVTLWTNNTMNPDGTIANETAGNGVVTNRTYDAVTHWLGAVTSGVGGGTGLENQGYLYDLIGTVTQRQNNALGLTENFYYDHDYRLTSSKLNTVQNLALTYDVNGNITSRSDIASGAAWTYDPNHYHEVTQAGSSAYSYTYDANGNAITRSASNLSWSSYNYPTSISASDASGTETVAFSYGPDRQRWQQNYNSGAEVTNYIGGLLEQVGSGGVTTWRHYVYAGREPVAVYARTSTLVNTWSYLYTDNLGSIAGIANSSGVTDVAEAFTAFGARRNPTTWSGVPTSGDLTTIASLTRQGYTFQTALGQSMGLNHMNGRVQDAITGRFLSADPSIPNPSNAQDYNRFSYADNNPLTLTDPTGFDDSCDGDLPCLPEQVGCAYCNSDNLPSYAPDPIPFSDRDLQPYNPNAARVARTYNGQAQQFPCSAGVDCYATPQGGQKAQQNDAADYLKCMASGDGASGAEVASNGAAGLGIASDHQADVAQSLIDHNRGSAFVDLSPGPQSLTRAAYIANQTIARTTFMVTGFTLGVLSTGYDAFSAGQDVVHGDVPGAVLNSASTIGGLMLLGDIAAPIAMPLIAAAKGTPLLLKDAACRASAGMAQPFTPFQ